MFEKLITITTVVTRFFQAYFHGTTEIIELPLQFSGIKHFLLFTKFDASP